MIKKVIKRSLLILFILIVSLLIFNKLKTTANFTDWASMSFDEITQYEPTSLFSENFSYTDQDDKDRVSGKYPNFICIERNVQGSFSMKLKAVMDVNLDGKGFDSYVIYNKDGGVYSGNSKYLAKMAYIAYKAGQGETGMYVIARAFNFVWEKESVRSLTHMDFPKVSDADCQKNNVYVDASTYANNGITDEGKVLSARILVFGNGSVQYTAMLYANEGPAQEVSIDKYITDVTALDPSITVGDIHLNDQRAGKTDSDKMASAVEVAAGGVQVHYKIVLKNSGAESVVGRLTDVYDTTYLGNLWGDAIPATDITLSPGEVREFNITLDGKEDVSSGKYKNTAIFKTLEKEYTSSDWVKVGEKIPPSMNKYIDTIDYIGQGRSGMTDDTEKRNNPAQAGDNTLSKTVEYIVEITNNNTDTEITGVFEDIADPEIQITNIYKDGMSFSNGSVITLYPGQTVHITIRATIKYGCPGGIYRNKATFTTNTVTIESSDFLEIIEPKDESKDADLHKWVSKVESGGSNVSSQRMYLSRDEDTSYDDKHNMPAEVEQGDYVTFTVKLYEHIHYQNGGDRDHDHEYCEEHHDEHILNYVKVTDTFDGSLLRYDSITGNFNVEFDQSESKIIWHDVEQYEDPEEKTELTANIRFEVLASNMYIPSIENKVSNIEYEYYKYKCPFECVYVEGEPTPMGTPSVHDPDQCYFQCQTGEYTPETKTGTIDAEDSDFVRVLDPVVSGTVFVDKNGNNLMDSGEDLTNMKRATNRKIHVELFNKELNQVVDETDVNTTTGTYSFGRVRKGQNKVISGPATDGTDYTFIGETKAFYYSDSSMYHYYIIFSYNGERYIAVDNHSDGCLNPTTHDITGDYKRDSNAEEEDRAGFNEKLTTIANNKAFDSEDGSGNQIQLDYDTNDENGNPTENLQVSTLTWTDKNSPITMKAKTFDVFYTDGEVEYLQYLNLGLVERPEADLYLRKDVVEAEVTVNGFITTYKYEKLGTTGYEFKTDDHTITPYVLRVYREDYEFRTTNYAPEIQAAMNANNPYKDMGRDNDLQIIITYKIIITNNSDTGLVAAVKEVVDYYSKELEYIPNTATLDGNVLNESGTSSYDNHPSCPSKCKLQFFTGSALSNKKLVNKGDELTIYAKYRVLKNADGYIEVDKATLSNTNPATDSKVNVAEVGAYSIYESDGSTPAGLVDINSNPANAEVDGDDFDEPKFEDDTFETAIAVVLRDYPDTPPPDPEDPPGTPPDPGTPPPDTPEKPEKTSYRNISGIVFEELAKTANADGHLVGDGTMSTDPTEDVAAANVLVKLYEVVQQKDSSGNVTKDYLIDTGMWYRTGDDGRYYFGDKVDGSLFGDSNTNSIDDRYRLHAGTYVVRFVYGDEADYLVTSDGTTVRYSGQDFKSTLYTEPGTAGDETEILEATAFTDISNNSNPFSGGFLTGLGNNIVSVAKDNEIRRLEVNQYSTTMTYPMDTVLKAYDSENTTDADKLGDNRRALTNIDEAKLLAANTSMFADTKAFNMQIEYIGNYDDANKASKVLDGTIPVDRLYYGVRDVNFGLIERPITKLQLMNDITEVRAITSDGTTLVDMFFNIIYEHDGTQIVHRTVPDYARSKGFEQVQVLNRNGASQGFRYVNVDNDLLQGMTITLKFQVAIANNSDIDHITTWLEKKIEGTPGDFGADTDLAVSFSATPAAEASSSDVGTTKVNIIDNQTRTYNYERNYLYNLLHGSVGQIGGDGVTATTLTHPLSTVGEDKIYDYAGGHGVGSDNVKKSYTYNNIVNQAQANYTPGYYVGEMYYTNNKAASETIVKTRLNQYIDYVDTDLVFKPEENLNDNKQITYQTYSIAEIAEKGLLRGIDNTVEYITDGEKNYVSNTPNTNNNLAFNIEDAAINPYFYKYMEPIKSSIFSVPVSEEMMAFDYNKDGQVSSTSADTNKYGPGVATTLGNPYDGTNAYNEAIRREFYFINLEASKLLTSEVDLEGVVLDNIAEIIKVSNTVGRKAYVKDDLTAEGFIGNTTKDPIAVNDPDPSRVLPRTLIELATPESDTDFTEYVTFSPPTGISDEDATRKDKIEKVTNTLLIAVPAVIIVIGVTYVTVEFVRRKKFYK